MRSLLDVNVLIALMDEDHIHHRQAMNWVGKNLDVGWASCAITQNGCLRIMTQSGYPGRASLSDFASRLNRAQLSAGHEFWVDEISLLDETIFDLRKVHGPRQLTDVYLLGLAAVKDGRFVTLDQKIPLSAVRAAKSVHLEVI